MSLDPRRPVSDIERIGYELKALKARLDELSAPSGTAAFRSVQRLTALVENIQQQLDEYNADRYTNAQIDDLIAEPPTDVHMLAGLEVDGATQLDGAVTSAGVADTIVTTGSWATMVVRTDAGGKGIIGYNPSRRDSKIVEGPLVLTIDDLLAAAPPLRFRYKMKNGQPGATPRVGMIAEDLQPLLPELVVIGPNGKPLTIEYSLMGVAAIAALAEAAKEYRAGLKKATDDLAAERKARADEKAAADKKSAELEARIKTLEQQMIRVNVRVPGILGS